VAAITIFIIIYINALNKRRQIGVLSAIGIDRSSIIISFVIQAFFFASCGIAIGAALIYGLVLPYFGAHPLDVAAGDVRPSVQSKLLVFAITSFLSAGIVAGFLPAWRVAKTNLLKAIWGN
jgi:putative ABC transport system permease protein